MTRISTVISCYSRNPSQLEVSYDSWNPRQLGVSSSPKILARISTSQFLGLRSLVVPPDDALAPPGSASHFPWNSFSETREGAPRSRIRYRGGGSELLHIKFTRKEQTLILALVLLVRSDFLGI